MRQPRKITLSQCIRQSDTTLIFYCVTERPPGSPAPYGGGPNVCGHSSELATYDALLRFGGDTSLSDLPAVCTICGGRDVDVRARGTFQLGARTGWA